MSFTEQDKRFCLILHQNRVNSYIFANPVEIYKCKVENSKINEAPLILVNALKNFAVDNMETTRLHRHFYDFSIHYDSIDIADILDIHKNLMKKHNINQCLDLFKKRCIGFVSVCVVGSFGASLAINYKDSIKC